MTMLQNLRGTEKKKENDTLKGEKIMEAPFVMREQ